MVIVINVVLFIDHQILKKYYESTIDKDGNCFNIQRIYKRSKKGAKRKLNNKFKKKIII